jgi:hypothetical protein
MPDTPNPRRLRRNVMPQPHRLRKIAPSGAESPPKVSYRPTIFRSEYVRAWRAK